MRLGLLSSSSGLSAICSLLLAAPALRGADAATLAERLGFNSTDKLLIVNADDTGMCHSANLAVMEAMEAGLVRSATIMVPCPWFPEIAAYAKANPDRAFGIHLCHTSEWKKYRWRPLAPAAQVPGLVDSEGFLWPDVPEVYSNATPRQALMEGRLQVQRALASGVDVTHLDSHMGTMQLHPDYLKAYLQLAVEFNLPVRMASQETYERAGFPGIRADFAAKGILYPDHFIYEELKEESKDVKGFWMRVVKDLKPGVTELYIHPAVASDELKAITGSWLTRSQEYQVFTHDPEMKQRIQDQGIKLISYRPLRELQRREHPSAAASIPTNPAR